MLTTTSNQLYHCSVHGPDHDLFLSYRVATDAATVQSLKEVLTSVAKRRYGQPFAVFHDIDCLRDAKKWKDGFLGALPRSRVFVAVISQASLESMIQKAESGVEDNVLLEIKTALDLVDSGVDISVMPLCVSSLVKDGEKEVWADCRPYHVIIPVDSKFDTLRAVLKGLSDIQMFGIRPDLIYKRVYRLLNLLHPIQVNDGTRQLLDSLFCDSKFRVDPAHLDTLLKQLTLTGRAVISGMGGMGKSVLALQILHFMMGTLDVSNKDDLKTVRGDTIGVVPQYSQVFWLNCSTESTALDGLCAMFDGVEPEKVKKHASKFLANTHSYLLVLDNVDNISVVDSVFEHSKSVGFSGDVVVTTRLASLPPGAFENALKHKIPGYRHGPLRLGTWDDTTTLRYILSISSAFTERTITKEDREALKRITTKIDGYPLVIQTFMTYAENNEVPLSEVERLFSKVLEEQDGEDDTRSSLKVIVDLSLDSLMKRGDEGIEAARLFGALSLVAPTNIQFELIKEIAQKMELKTDVTDLIKTVIQSGLLRSGTEGQYSTHSLTQQVAREYVQANSELNSDAIEDATGEALIELTNSMDLKAQPFAEHLDQYAGRTVPDVYTKEFHHHIEFRVARLAEEKILYTKAMKTYKRNLRRSVVFYGTRKYPAIAMTLNNMGHVAWKQGRLDEALTFYQESLDISVKINGTREHPAIAMTLNNMGNVESDQGRLDEALTFYQESLDIKVKIYGTRQHPDVATTLNNMGNVAWKQGRLDEALALYQESLDIKVKVYGTREHPEVAMTLNNMGAVASDQGRLDEALALYQESLDIKVKLYGTNQREEVAIMLHNMCYISRLLGRPTQALQYANQCLDIYLELYGTREHSSVAGILDEFGWIHFLQSNFAKALQYHTEALDIVTRISNDPTRAQEAEFLIGCGADLIHLGQLDHAQSKLEKSLELLRAIHSTTDDALIAHALCWLGDLRRLQGNGDDALILYNDAIHMVKRLSRPSNPIITPQALHGITVIQRFRKQLDAARQSITQAIDILLERASDHPYLQDLATLSIELDRNSETSAHIGDCSVM